MNIEWTELIISVFLFLLIAIYDLQYAPFCRKMKYEWSRKKRTVFRNILFTGLVIFDFAVVILIRNDNTVDYEKKVLFYGCLVLGILHIINNLFALAKFKKMYSAGYVIEYVLRFIAVVILLGIQYFVTGGTHILYTLTAMYFISRQGMRLLEGDALELRLDDISMNRTNSEL